MPTPTSTCTITITNNDGQLSFSTSNSGWDVADGNIRPPGNAPVSFSLMAGEGVQSLDCITFDPEQPSWLTYTHPSSTEMDFNETPEPSQPSVEYTLTWTDSDGNQHTFDPRIYDPANGA